MFNRCSAGNIFIVCLALLVSVCIIVFALFYDTSEGNSPTDFTGSRSLDTLKLVILVSRHGNRRYLFPQPNDSVHWNYGLGELTTRGRAQAYHLGVRVRSMYNGFLRKEYLSADVLASSTPMDRTMMSGQLFLAGLFPPSGYQVWNNELPWQPIPLYDNSPDLSSSGFDACPRLIKEAAESVRVFEESNIADVTAISSFLSGHLGYNLTGLKDMYNVWDLLVCEEGEGLPVPEWVKPVFPQPMKDLMAKAMVARSAGTASTTRLSIGTFIQAVVSIMARKVNGTLSPDRRFYYHSGHDTTLVSLQALLGVPRESIPLVEPSSALVLELHQDAEVGFYVEVLYIDGRSTSTSPQQILLPACSGGPCDFLTWVNITQQYSNVTDYKLECQT